MPKTLYTFGAVLVLAACGAASAQAGSLSVSSQAVVYSPAGTTADGSVAAGPIAVSGGDTLTFSVTGSITAGCGSTAGCISLNGGGNFNDPDGVGAAPSSSSNSGFGSISGITAPNAGYLVGVFVPSGGPSGSAPTALDYTMTNFSSSSPVLDQVFFIGDGLTGDGTGSVQTFIAPTGAGDLYLGISDACGYNGAPSCYDDNQGSYNVTYTDTAGTISATPLPAALPLFAGGLGAIGLFGWRRKKKPATLAA